MGTSWGVLRETPSLVGVIAMGIAGHVGVSLSLLFLTLGRWPAADDLRFPQSVVVLPIIGAGAYVSTFCNAVVVATAHARIDGRPASVRDGLRLASARLPQLVAWTTVSIAVGTLLHVIAERLGIAGRIANWVLGLAWSLATVFIVPVLVIEGTSVRRGVPRSAHLFRGRWGETMTAEGGMGLITFLVGLAVCPFVGLVALVSVPLAVMLGIAAVATGMVVHSAFGAVLTAALYHYASNGRALGGFSEDDLAGSFTPG